MITTGGGGALITNNAELAEKARHISTTAKLAHPWAFEHDEIGWNDRMPNINAALGVAQLERLDKRLTAKRDLAHLYSLALKDLDDVDLVPQPDNCQSNFWLSTVRFKAENNEIAEMQRLELLKTAHSQQIMLRPVWKPLNQLQMYKNCPSGPLTVSKDEACRLINLPSSPQLLNQWQS